MQNNENEGLNVRQNRNNEENADDEGLKLKQKHGIEVQKHDIWSCNISEMLASLF